GLADQALFEWRAFEHALDQLQPLRPCRRRELGGERNIVAVSHHGVKMPVPATWANQTLCQPVGACSRAPVPDYAPGDKRSMPRVSSRASASRTVTPATT